MIINQHNKSSPDLAFGPVLNKCPERLTLLPTLASDTDCTQRKHVKQSLQQLSRDQQWQQTVVKIITLHS